MLQVLKMSTWLSVTHLPNETQFLTNEGTEIYRPVTENQVVKMSTSFFVPSQGLLKIRYRHPVLDFTRNGISGSKWPTEKAGRAAGRNSQIFACQLARSKSAERCGSPAATSKGHWPFEAPTEPTGETSSLRRSRTAVLPSGCDALRHILLGIIWRIAGGRFAASLHRVAPVPAHGALCVTPERRDDR